MQTICFVNNKGGVGKTTSTHNVGVALARYAKSKVLFIDLDSQASLTRCFGYNNLKFLEADSGSFILGELPIEKVIVRTEVGDLLPASMAYQVREDKIKSSPVFPFNLKFALEKIRNQYDFVVIDCPPALSVSTRIALVASDYYFVPLQAEFLSYEGLRNFLSFASQLSIISPNLELGGVFATRYNPKTNKKLSREIVKTTKQQLNGSFMNSYIRDSVAVPESQSNSQDIFEYAENSNAAVDYYNLTKEIIHKKFTKKLMEQVLRKDENSISNHVFRGSLLQNQLVSNLQVLQ